MTHFTNSNIYFINIKPQSQQRSSNSVSSYKAVYTVKFSLEISKIHYLTYLVPQCSVKVSFKLVLYKTKDM